MNDQLLTASTDKTIKSFKLEPMEQVSEFKVNSYITQSIPDKEKHLGQLLSVTHANDNVVGLLGTGDIFKWSQPGETDQAISGHSNYVTQMEEYNGLILSGDVDGKILTWNLETGAA